MKINCVHFYVENAIKTRDWFVRKIGFQSLYSKNDGQTQTEAIVYHSVGFLISSPLKQTSPVAKFLKVHAEGVADIAFFVKDVDSIVAKARRLNIRVWQYRQTFNKQAKIGGWDYLTHTLIEKKELQNCGSTSGIDHLVLNVPVGQLTEAVEFYRALLGFEVRQTFNIKTDSSGLFSKALTDRSGEVRFNINEPTSPNSQIQEFLDFNGGSGIQHLALRSRDLIATVKEMRDRGMDFFSVPKIYYSKLQKWKNISNLEWTTIAQQQILVDGDRDNPEALLMQIFTKPIFDKPTFFLEFIERRQNAKGFGKGNFMALFEAVEREQAKRK